MNKRLRFAGLVFLLTLFIVIFCIAFSVFKGFLISAIGVLVGIPLLDSTVKAYYEQKNMSLKDTIEQVEKSRKENAKKKNEINDSDYDDGL